MNSELAEYGKIFSCGHRIRVAIPTTEGTTFTDWADILHLDADLLEIQLSRQALPVAARLSLGTMLELRTGAQGSGYRCRSIIVSLGPDRTISIRLTGDVILDELREYFRIDVYLPIRIFRPHSQNPQAVKEEWLQKRAATITRTRHFQPHDNAGHMEYDEGHPHSSSPPIPTPTAANISGGGLRATVPERLDEGEIVLLEVYLPQHPAAILDIVGQVITTTSVEASEEIYYSTAMRFYLIDERDRDRIIHYVTTEQLVQLRHFRKGLDIPPDADNYRNRGRKTVMRVMVVSLLCLFFIWLASWFVSYHRSQPKSEVQRIFEKGIRQYLNRSR